ncbi:MULTISPECIES: hypothetical protein [unclassified Synechococcus]|uniref:FitA-like ribbon-helix-helix domain-containing protein n=1 Tax=unclassified Synechococcus TaxID=2626047 RepID=UPI0012EAAF56|nr:MULTISPECIES: hypothetical protein [unclassified Synechococcus]WFN58706.1 hypothetical protein N4320_13055 [Synechococcus sp. CCFWC 502]
MAQLLVRNLDVSVKEALRRRAQRHGRSMEEEARLPKVQGWGHRWRHCLPAQG